MGYFAGIGVSAPITAPVILLKQLQRDKPFSVNETKLMFVVLLF